MSRWERLQQTLWLITSAEREISILFDSDSENFEGWERLNRQRVALRAMFAAQLADAQRQTVPKDA